MRNIGLLYDKSYAFALRIINAYKFLQTNGEHILSKQLLRSGTSIGANCKEAQYAQSKADFINKLHVALKEASETSYWLDLLKDSNFIDAKSYDSIYSDNIIKLMTAIIKTTKRNIDA